MNLPSILIISVILGVDAFSLSLGIGLKGIRKKQAYLLALIIAVLHAIMPLIGLYLGRSLGSFVGPIAGKIGASVLIFIGANALWQKWRCYHQPEKKDLIKKTSLDNPLSLTILALSVSLDALTVGFGLGVLRANLVLTVTSIGIVAGVMTLLGFFCGEKLSCRFGENAEIIGSLVLIFIGIKLFFY